jgi:protein SCO1/2
MGLILLALLCAACSPSSAARLHGSPYDAPALAPELGLVDTAGAPFRLEALRDNVVLIYFGYTQCPDECPLTLANVRWAVEALGDLGERLAMILVTVDPANDSPQVLRAYLDRFNPRFIGLLGTDDELAQARLAYGVLAATPESGHGHGDVLHGTRLYLIDPQGLLVTSYDMSVPKEDILEDARALLEAGS